MACAGRRRADHAADLCRDLARLAEAAKDQRRLKLEAVCRLAITTITTLEATLTQLHASRRSASVKRAATLTPERRKAIATKAALHRWGGAAVFSDRSK